MRESEKITSNLMPHTRISDARGRGFVHLNDYEHLFHMIIEGGIKPFQGKDGFSSIVKLTSTMNDDFKPFAVLWRSEMMPIVLHMAPTLTADNVFTVGVRVVPPNIGHAAVKLITEDIDGDYDEMLNHNHYLLNEIALRAGLALCYESTTYDNETVRILCCVEDDLDYTSAVDTEAYPTKNERLEIIGVMYDDATVDRTSSEMDYDAKFFPAEFSQLDEFFEDNFTETAPVITKVEAYLDTRAPYTWGKSEWWVEMIRCGTCGQRVILNLAKAQCPDGLPDVSFACKACRTTIKHL